ncbi:MAG: hypothetical protein H7832_03015 [Magnetococcus sp. DMHC-6]
MTTLFNPTSPIQWIEDRGRRTPAYFSNAENEFHILTQDSGLIDLSHFGIVAVSGADRLTFLSHLITNQIRHVSPERAIYAALLTPQGRFLWDFIIIETEEAYLLCTEPDRVASLTQRLSLYVLRSKVTITNVSAQFALLALAGPQSHQHTRHLFPDMDLEKATLGATFTTPEGIKLWRDPRSADFGWRILVERQKLTDLWQTFSEKVQPIGFLAWEHFRIYQSLPRGGNEFIPDLSIPTESGLIEMNGVDFTKGCYIGQETISRTHHRGTLKKRLYQVTFTEPGPFIPSQSTILQLNGQESGLLTSFSNLCKPNLGLAILRVSDVETNHKFSTANRQLTTTKPTWATWD